jgi:Cdc6-like AAA superfamily ATPase
MIELPKTKVPAKSQSPDILLLYSLPKSGKTSVVAQLENCLIIDLENGTNKVDAMKVNANTLAELREVVAAIAEANEKNKGFVYRYIAVDTATKLEEFAEELAVDLYKRTPMGAKFQGGPLELKALEYGAGYGYIRQGYKILMNSIRDLCDRFILIGHTKDKYVTKNNKEVTGTEVDLSGKLAGIVTQKVCAIGYAYRKRNALHVSFKTDGEILNGNRSKHLSGKDIILSESDPETGEITSYWDRIYID